MARGLFRVAGGATTTPTTPTEPMGNVTPWSTNITTKGISEFLHPVHPEHIYVVDDPAGVKESDGVTTRKVLKMETHNGDTGPTENPRTQLETPPLIDEGTEFWVGQGMYFPTSTAEFPLLPTGVGAWQGFGGVWGPPFTGSSSWRLVYHATDYLAIDRNGDYAWDQPWAMNPLQRGKWIDVVYHGLHSNDPTKGFWELWVNTGAGFVQQTFAGGSKRITMKTRSDGQNGGLNHWSPCNYMMKDMVEKSAMYIANPRIGRTLAEADPGSYR